MSEGDERFDEFLRQTGFSDRIAADPSLRDLAKRAFEAHPFLLQQDAAYQKELHDRWFKHREWLVSTGFEVAGNFDRDLITLPSGAIALSITLFNVLNTASPRNHRRSSSKAPQR